MSRDHAHVHCCFSSAAGPTHGAPHTHDVRYCSCRGSKPAPHTREACSRRGPKPVPHTLTAPSMDPPLTSLARAARQQERRSICYCSVEGWGGESLRKSNKQLISRTISRTHHHVGGTIVTVQGAGRRAVDEPPPSRSPAISAVTSRGFPRTCTRAAATTTPTHGAGQPQSWGVVPSS